MVSSPASDRALFLLVAAGLGFGSCAQPEPNVASIPLVEPAKDPEFRIAVLVNVQRAVLGGGAALRVEDSDAGDLRTIPAGGTADASARANAVTLVSSGSRVDGAVLVIRPVDAGATFRLNGREYRGVLELRGAGGGFVAVNRVSLETYLAGVVSAEMGRRTPAEAEALKAQAIVSRTYAIRNQGRWKDHGFDLMSSVNDQVYAGEPGDNPLATAAVAATRGQVLTWNNQPIDAFFSSTCGGTTEDGVSAFAGADRPYLHSVDDHDPGGTAWCAGSPRMRWATGWTARELAATLRRTLAAENLPGARATDLADVRVTGRSRTGRVASLELTGRSGRTVVVGQGIRRVLSPPDGGILRSTDFTVRITRNGGRLERVDIDGRGNGHAVGMCQWGAIGRARAGQDYRTILTGYFPGTELQALY